MTTYIISGITYDILDNNPTTDLSIIDIQSILDNLHSTESYTQAMDDLKALSVAENNPSLAQIDIFIDLPGVRTGISTTSFQININSSEFQDSADYIVTEQGQLMQNTVDFALAHEIGHLLDVRLNGTILTGNSAQQEITAIQFENTVRGDIGLPLRAEYDHARIDPSQFDITKISTWAYDIFGKVELLDPAQSAGINILGSNYYSGTAPAMVPTTDANALVSTGEAFAAAFSLFSNTASSLNTATSTALANWYGNIQSFFGQVSNIWDPLVIDLDRDGITTDYIGTQDRYFDLDEDGFAELTTWAGAQDGFLARDINGNGQIDNGGELFGDATTNGFAALAEFDDNNDGLVTVADTIWGDLVVWQDANSDGVTQDGELLSLSSLDITGFDVAGYQVANTALNALTHTGTAFTSAGTLEVGNFNFEISSVNTRYVQDYSLDIRALFLTTLRGYNEMPDLHIALSLDNDESDPNSLMSIMLDIASYSSNAVFENYSTIEGKITDLFYRWAGVDGISASSRGTFISDARIVEFMEEYMGQDFVDANIASFNPGEVQAREMEGLWNDTILARLGAYVLTQGATGEIFDTPLSYTNEAELTGSSVVSQAALDDLETAATALANSAARQMFWVGVADYLNGVSQSGSYNITVSEAAKLKAAVEASDSSLTWAQADHDPSNGVTSIEYKFNNPDGESILGDSSANSNLVGSSLADTISGLAADDVILGGDGNDEIFGHSVDGTGDDNAADTLMGGNGNDALYGQGGNDWLSGEFGSDHLVGGAGDDTLVDGSISTDNTSTQNLLEGQQGDDNYDIVAGTNSFKSEVNIVDTTGFEELRFLQNPVGSEVEYDIENITFTRLGNDSLKLSAFAVDVVLVDQFTALNDQAGAGVESIRSYVNGVGSWIDIKDYLLNTTRQISTLGSDADEIINGITIGDLDDHIQAFGGDDAVNGGLGDDSIFGGDGNDTLNGDEGNDSLYGQGGINIINGGAGNDDLFSGALSDSLNGNDGNDNLYGGSGDNILNGGLGNDFLIGSAGDDLYVFSSGLDNIQEYGSSGINDIDDVILINTVLPEDVTFSNINTYDLELSVSGFTGSTSILWQRNNSESEFKIERAEFDDGFSLRLDAYNLWALDSQTASSSDETITGYSHIFTNGGTDRVYGYNGPGTDIISTGAGDDFLYGQYGDDHLHAGSGNDYIEAGLGNDRIWGSTGNDTLSFVSSSTGVTASLLTGISSGEGQDIFTSIENLIGSSHEDTLIGDNQNNILDGGDDIDTADYSSATSSIVVSLLNTNWTYDGTNTIAASTAYDGLGGTDTLLNIENIIGSDHKDYLRGSNSFGSTFHAGAGHDEILGQALDDIIYAGTGNDFVSASGGNDIVYGDTGRDNIFGGNGNDELHSGDGDDWINGGNGDDTMYGDDGIDILTGGNGNDTMYGGAGDDIVNSNDGNDILYGGDGNDTMRGYTGDDELHGGDGNDLLFGGKNIYDTFDSDDVLYGDAGNDILYGLGGNDTMYGGEGNDNLYGYDDNDTLRGEGGIDTLRGGNGDDILYSEGDRDKLFGEAGADTFKFEGMSAYDDLTFIQDFDASEGDILDISNILTGFTQGTSDINDYLTFSEAVGDTFVWADSNGADAGGNYAIVARLIGTTGLNLDTLLGDGNIVV